jgi:hypothetical protein
MPPGYYYQGCQGMFLNSSSDISFMFAFLATSPLSGCRHCGDREAFEFLSFK